MQGPWSRPMRQLTCSWDQISGMALVPSEVLGFPRKTVRYLIALINSFSDEINQRFLYLMTENPDWYTKSGNILLLLVKGHCKIYRANKYSEILPVSQGVRVSSPTRHY